MRHHLHFLVRGQDYDATRGEMRGEQTLQLHHGTDIERGKRFIENPQRHRGGNGEPGQGHAAALSLRKYFRRQFCAMGNTEAIEPGEHAPGFGGHPCQCRCNLQVFQRREIVLQGIEMADEDEIPRILLAFGADRPPAPAQLPRAWRKQAAHNAQQARLAAAVGSSHAQQLAATETEAQFAE